MRKSLHIGIKDAVAQTMRHKRIGDAICFNLRLDGPVLVEGKVLVAHRTTHGLLLLVQNKHYYNWKRGTPYTPPRGVYYYAETIPLWISECGNSGLLATWLDTDYRAAMKTLEGLKAEREREVERCMAL